MWSFFSRDSAKDFNYEIGEYIGGLEDKSIWKLHKGKKKVSGEIVSIYIFDIKSSGEVQHEIAKASLKKLKTLRHPSVITYLDDLETDKVIYLVTEYVEPLCNHLPSKDSIRSKQHELTLSWGLHQIIRAINFLNTDCNVIHNNICMWSIYVNRAGEWKLGGLEYMFPFTETAEPPRKILPLLEKYDPPERSQSSQRIKTAKWSTDMWGYGCLIWEVFNGPLSMPASLKNIQQIPKSLASQYCELVGANPVGRPSPAAFLQQCEARGGFFNNVFVTTLLFLEEIQIKDSLEKAKFFGNLTSVLDSFPSEVCKYKILPHLIHAFEFGNAGSAVLAPMFKLGKLLDDDEYQKKIVPCVVKLFSSTDRATRARLLQQMEHFIYHLQPPLVNDQIFPQVVQGFSDTNPTIRETTVKAMLHVASKLNYNNLNVELMKHFARLQANDEHGGIRTNTTICLGKIASYLHPQTRQKVLIPAFTRAMRDPFSPARVAGIMALAATQNYYPLQHVALKVIPILSPLCIDPDKAVRDQAFKTIKGFLSKLETVSKDPSKAVEIEAEVNVINSPTMADTAASWAGWAVASLTSKFYKGDKGKRADVDPAQDSGSNLSPATIDKNQVEETHDDSKSAAGPRLDSDVDDWNDDWGEMDNATTSTANSTEIFASQETVTDGNDWEDWSSLGEAKFQDEETPESSSSRTDADFIPADPDMKRTSSYDWGDKHSSEVNLFTQDSAMPSVKSNHKDKKDFTPNSSDNSAGWDIDDSNWDAWQPTYKESANRSSKESREEKRVQRQKEMQEKRAAKQTSGAMKLGEKKKLPNF